MIIELIDNALPNVPTISQWSQLLHHRMVPFEPNSVS